VLRSPEPTVGVKGNPERNVRMPFVCQPFRIPAVTPVNDRPTGISQTQWIIALWV
jgi:hypothetical protein